MLSETEREDAIKDLERLESRVKVLNFTDGSEHCMITTEFLEEVSGLSERLELQIFNLGGEVARKYGIERAPATALLNKAGRDYGIRFYGVPSDNELVSLIEAMVDVSRGTTDLTQESKEKIKKVHRELHLEVFVSHTCPFCPLAVMFAHKLAVESEFIRGDMIVAPEFPELREKYSITGLPRVVVNGGFQFGGLPEKEFVEKVLEACR